MLVYVAGPYTKPKPLINMLNNIQAQMRIMDAVPGVVCVSGVNWHEAYRLENSNDPAIYDKWLNRALTLVSKCEVLYRLPGESSGADEEVEVAKQLGILIFYDEEELIRYLEV